MHHLLPHLILLSVCLLSVHSIDLNHQIRKNRDDPVVPDDYWLKQQLRTHMTSSQSDSAAKSVKAVKVALPPGLKPAARVVGLPPGLNLRPAVSVGSAPSPSSFQSSPVPKIAVVTDAPAEELPTTTEEPESSSPPIEVFTARIPEVPVDLPPAVNSRRVSGVANVGASRPTVSIPVVGGRRALQLPQVGRKFTFAVSNTLENRERTKEEARQNPNSGVVKSVVQSVIKNVTLEDTPGADNSSSKPKINRIVTTAEDVTQNEEVDISFGPASAKHKRQIGGLDGGLSFLQSPLGGPPNLGDQTSFSGKAASSTPVSAAVKASKTSPAPAPEKIAAVKTSPAAEAVPSNLPEKIATVKTSPAAEAVPSNPSDKVVDSDTAIAQDGSVAAAPSAVAE